MEAQSSDEADEVIRLGGPMPTLIRWILVGAGLFACVMVVVELGRGLWPLSPLSLFFGLIIAGGLFVGLAFIIFGGLSPDEQWEIRPGLLTLTWSRGQHRLERHYTAEDLEDLTVVRDDSGDGPDTWHLLAQIRLESSRLISLQTHPVFAGVRWLAYLRAPLTGLGKGAAFHDRIRSPGLTTDAAAQRALLVFFRDSKRLQ